MLEDVEMRLLCWKRVDKDALVRAQDVVLGGYVAEWIMDNLPGATQFVTPDRARKYYAAGFKVGFESTSAMGMPMYFINNHFTLVIPVQHGARPRRAEWAESRCRVRGVPEERGDRRSRRDGLPQGHRERRARHGAGAWGREEPIGPREGGGERRHSDSVHLLGLLSGGAGGGLAQQVGHVLCKSGRHQGRALAGHCELARSFWVCYPPSSQS